jgi:hypothetical protein
MYQVGFGDCFLVSFLYPAPVDGRSDRHVLIDFGSTRRAPQGIAPEAVAHLIAEHSNGQLDVLVVSHRHKDHLSGFSADAAAAVIDGLSPRLVLRSWTEDPTAPADAPGPSALGERSRQFLRGIQGGQGLAAALVGAIPERSRGLLGGLRGFALDQLANQEALQRLDGWAANGAGRYLHAGSPSGIEELIPGLRVRVLGPPTLEQWPEIARQRAEDPEYWMLYRRVVDEGAFEELAAATQAVERERAVPGDVGPERWLIQRMRRQELGSLLRIVRILDDVLNNTSLILVFEVGDKRMLFPGDAQIENWNFALKNAPDAEELREALARVDLYKVGHHGSRNATPRTLFGLWTEGDARERPMVGLLSTLSGVHGETEATRVPRATLVAALEERMSLLSTEGLPPDEPFAQYQADLSSDAPFRQVRPPSD